MSTLTSVALKTFDDPFSLVESTDQTTRDEQVVVVEASTSSTKAQLEWLKKIATSTGKSNLVTKTVTGFLDFVTTIGDTVLIFTPQATSGIVIHWMGVL